MAPKFFIEVFDSKTKRCVISVVAVRKNTLLNKIKEKRLAIGDLVKLEKIGERSVQRATFVIKEGNFTSQLEENFNNLKPI